MWKGSQTKVYEGAGKESSTGIFRELEKVSFSLLQKERDSRSSEHEVRYKGPCFRGPRISLLPSSSFTPHFQDFLLINKEKNKLTKVGSCRGHRSLPKSNHRNPGQVSDFPLIWHMKSALKFPASPLFLRLELKFLSASSRRSIETEKCKSCKESISPLSDAGIKTQRSRVVVLELVLELSIWPGPPCTQVPVGPLHRCPEGFRVTLATWVTRILPDTRHRQPGGS